MYKMHMDVYDQAFSDVGEGMTMVAINVIIGVPMVRVVEKK